MTSSIIFLYPSREHNNDVNQCISYVIKETYKQHYDQSVKQKNIQDAETKVEYFNNTVPNKLFLIIKENKFPEEEELMKRINYSNVDTLGNLISSIQALESNTGTIIIEKLLFIIKNTRMEYQEINRLIIKLFRLLREHKGTHYIIELHENYFMSNNCDSDISI